MSQFIILFGALTCLTGIVILINPEVVFGILRENYTKIELHIFAVGVRIVLGTLLLYQADVSKYPTVIAIIGWMSIVAAIVFALMGRTNFCKLMTWAMSRVKAYSQCGGVAATGLGAFLVHAFL